MCFVSRNTCKISSVSNTCSLCVYIYIYIYIIVHSYRPLLFYLTSVKLTCSCVSFFCNVQGFKHPAVCLINLSCAAPFNSRYKRSGFCILTLLSKEFDQRDTKGKDPPPPQLCNFSHSTFDRRQNMLNGLKGETVESLLLHYIRLKPPRISPHSGLGTEFNLKQGVRTEAYRMTFFFPHCCVP